LVLDTADGHLARLQGTASEFGRWLDAVLDELADMLLHAAIAWGGFRLSGDPRWLLLALAYATGKYLFVVAQHEPQTSQKGDAATLPDRPSRAAMIVRMIGHADVRWHLWIGLAAFGRLDLALIAYAAYFPIRTAALAVRKAVRHA
jgi:phosphatidylglycerophosphate synthase